MARRTVLCTVALVALLALASCTQGPPQSGGEARVGEGMLATGAWSAWAYGSVGSGVCLQIRIEGEAPNTLCGLESDGMGLWTSDAPGTTFVSGTSNDGRATTARVTLADRSELRAALVPAPEVTDLRFFVVPVVAGARPTIVELLDAGGTVIDSVQLE